jgi:hypothetical protein
VTGLYHEGNRHLQDAFDSRRLADRLDAVKVRDHIDEGDKAFVENLDMFFPATADGHGRPTCTYIHHYEQVERSRSVPRPHQDTPVPDRKRADWAADVLPEGDHARR